MGNCGFWRRNRVRVGATHVYINHILKLFFAIWILTNRPSSREPYRTPAPVGFATGSGHLHAAAIFVRTASNPTSENVPSRAVPFRDATWRLRPPLSARDCSKRTTSPPTAIPPPDAPQPAET